MSSVASRSRLKFFESAALQLRTNEDHVNDWSELERELRIAVRQISMTSSARSGSMHRLTPNDPNEMIT